MFFQTPLFLLLLVIPLGFWLGSWSVKSEPFHNVMTKNIRKKLFVPAKTFSSRTRYSLFLLSVVLFIVALARPVTLLPFLEVTQTKPSVVLAMDMSGSMKQTDIFPSRLALAKEKAQIFIQKAVGYKIGLILYANDAYMLYPVSEENTLLTSLLKDANITQKFAPNSNLFSALEASSSLLKNHQNRHIVLLSDGGEDVTRGEELRYLKSNNITLSTLAITPKTNLSMKTLCQGTEGYYQPFSWSGEDVTNIMMHISSSQKSSQKKHYNLPQYKEYFSYPLALGLLLLALLFFPLKQSSVFLLLFYLQPSPLQAGLFDFWYLHQAQTKSEKKNYAEAISYYQQMTPTKQVEYNLAYALYQNDQYNKAIVHYKKALGKENEINAKIYYNIATAFARQNKLDFAKKYYKKSLALSPSTLAQENLSLILLALKKQRKKYHKKGEKLKFKAIVDNPVSKNNPFSTYAIKLHKFLPSEEELWFQKVAKHHSPTYLQKIHTTQRSLDANLTW